MLTEFLLGGWAATAVTAYVQTVRLRSARRQLAAAQRSLEHLLGVIDDLKNTDSKLADPDERERLRDKITE